MKSHVYSLGLLLALGACGPKLSTTINNARPPLDLRQEIRIFNLQEDAPINAQVLGAVKVGDTGFSTNCGWEVAMDRIETVARKVGGNAVKITAHTPPNVFGSTCHKVAASILYVDNIENLQEYVEVDSSLIGADYALLHIYRHSGLGALIGYDLHLGDSAICRVKNKWKQTVKVNKDGLNTLWAKTEAKAEIPVKIEFGKEYYVRCGIKMGAFVGHPAVELVDRQTGRAEYESIQLKVKKANDKDIVVLNDGREIECQINNEDQEKIYVTMDRDGVKIETTIEKFLIDHVE